MNPIIYLTLMLLGYTVYACVAESDNRSPPPKSFHIQELEQPHAYCYVPMWGSLAPSDGGISCVRK